MRRLKEDVLDDLPPKIIQDYYCELSPLQQDLYEEYGKAAATDADGREEKGGQTHVFQALQYLKRLVNHPTLVIQRDNEKHQKILARHSIKGTSMNLKDISQAPKLLALKYALQSILST